MNLTHNSLWPWLTTHYDIDSQLIMNLTHNSLRTWLTTHYNIDSQLIMTLTHNSAYLVEPYAPGLGAHTTFLLQPLVS